MTGARQTYVFTALLSLGFALIGLSLAQDASVDTAFYGTLVELEPQTIAAGRQHLELDIRLPEGYQFNDIAPFSMRWHSEAETVSFAEDAEVTLVKPDFPMRIHLNLEKGQVQLQGDVHVYFCEYESLGICLFEELRFHMPILVTENTNATTLMAHYDVPEPEGLNDF